jgi:glucose-6-phosphate 1-dehydrogenase
MMQLKSEQYPVCSLDSGGFKPEPAVFVVFGATGDLSHRKIFPALFDLYSGGILPEELLMIGFARKDLDHKKFREGLRQGCASFARAGTFNEEQWKKFSSRIFYLRSDLEDPRGYVRLADVLAARENGFFKGSDSIPKNILFYLAVGPEHFGTISDRLGEVGLGSRRDRGTQRTASGAKSATKQGWRRLVVEKPYGRDGESAKELTLVLQRSFAERDIYRIDHYLGKETVQNLLYLRFANSVFEPIWNRHHIEAIDISVFETVGIGDRGGYYESAGAARDMLQNHLIQLMCLATMEPPASLDPENIHNEKVKVLQSIASYSPSSLLSRALRGQYVRGVDAMGQSLPGYREETRVKPDSSTETYVALTLELDNWRFAGVPIRLRTGKAFASKFSQIVIHFRKPPAALFTAQCGESLINNTLTIQIQPDEGVWLRFNAKIPGMSAIKANELRFSFKEVSEYLPEAYERLIADALAGDSTLFIRADESQQAWRIVDTLESAWAKTDPGASPEKGGLLFYPAGSPIPEIGS